MAPFAPPEPALNRSRKSTPRPSTQTKTIPIVTSSARARPPSAPSSSATRTVATNRPTRRSTPAAAAASAPVNATWPSASPAKTCAAQHDEPADQAAGQGDGRSPRAGRCEMNPWANISRASGGAARAESRAARASASRSESPKRSSTKKPDRIVGEVGRAPGPTQVTSERDHARSARGRDRMRGGELAGPRPAGATSSANTSSTPVSCAVAATASPSTSRKRDATGPARARPGSRRRARRPKRRTAGARPAPGTASTHGDHAAERQDLAAVMPRNEPKSSVSRSSSTPP